MRITLAVLVAPCLLFAQFERRILSINEFMAAPDSGQIEFIEFIYHGDSEISLFDWKISDSRISKTYKLPDVVLLPQDYLIVASDSSLLDNVPENAVYVVPVNGFPILNNSGDQIKIFDPLDTLIDSLFYDTKWNIKKGLSNEKIIPWYLSEFATSWKNCVSPNRLTPGAENSVTPLKIDGAIGSDPIVINPEFPTQAEAFTLTFPIVNLGQTTITGKVRIKSANILLKSAISRAITLGDTAFMTLLIPGFNSGSHIIDIDLEIAGDENLNNNLLTQPLHVSFLFETVRFNEFLARPNNNQSEFVELISDKDLNLENWSIADKTKKKYVLLQPAYIHRNDYIVLLEDSVMIESIPEDAPAFVLSSGFPSLNNNGDSIYLYDMTGALIDSLQYNLSWPLESERSTEKIYPSAPSLLQKYWNVSSDPNGMTPGTHNSVLISDVDGALIADNVRHTPFYPSGHDSITITVPFTNSGVLPISGTVQISIGENNNIPSSYFKDLLHGDTLTVHFRLPPLSPGNNLVSISLIVPNDQDTVNNFSIDTIIVRYPFGAVTINEFLSLPTGDQLEFIELVSFYDIDLTRWAISDNSHNPAIFPFRKITVGDFVVISRDAAFQSHVADASEFITLPSLPVLNNKSDAIVLFDPAGTIIDSLFYDESWNIKSGHSMEKIRPEFASDIHKNWQISIDTTKMTPGLPNSVLISDVDGALITNEVRHFPLYPSGHDSITVTVPFTNGGVLPITGLVQIATAGIISIPSHHFEDLLFGDTLTANFRLPPLSPGNNQVSISLIVPNDQNTSNNLYTDSIFVRYPFGALTINEFLPAPIDDQLEFVELFSFYNIDLRNWAISDNTKKPKNFPSGTISTGDFTVISRDSAFKLQVADDAVFIAIHDLPILNNLTDAIYLFDPTGAIIDSLYYNEGWNINNGRSMEKVRPEFPSDTSIYWRVSIHANRMTPGSVNSVYIKDMDGAVLTDSIRYEPIIPSQNDVISVAAPIFNTGLRTISGSVSIFKIAGEELSRRTFEPLLPGDTTTIHLQIEPLPPGTNSLRLLLDITGDDNKSNDSGDFTVTVHFPFAWVTFNEFLAQPDTLQSEFIELIGFSEVDLSAWSISDASGNKRVLRNGMLKAEIPFVVLTDSTLLDLLPDKSAAAIPEGGLPTLNNNGDALYLLDITGTVIDSLSYNTNSWTLVHGRSNEKFRPDMVSNNPLRWGVAVNFEAMTPGRQNSLYLPRSLEMAGVILEPNPFSPDHDGFEDVLSIKVKTPFPSATIKLEIFDMVGRAIATPYWNLAIPQETIFTWNGVRDNGSPARIGLYILKITATNSIDGRQWEAVQTFVLAKKL